MQQGTSAATTRVGGGDKITKPMEKTFPRLRIILVGVAGRAAGRAPRLRAPACLPSPPPPPPTASSRTLARHRCTPLRPHDTHTHGALWGGSARPSGALAHTVSPPCSLSLSRSLALFSLALALCGVHCGGEGVWWWWWWCAGPREVLITYEMRASGRDHAWTVAVTSGLEEGDAVRQGRGYPGGGEGPAEGQRAVGGGREEGVEGTEAAAAAG